MPDQISALTALALTAVYVAYMAVAARFALRYINREHHDGDGGDR